MPRKSPEQRLVDLKQQAETIRAQIKQIESEQSQVLRKRKEQRARVIGMAMLKLVEQGQWTEEQLMSLIAPMVTSGKEKRLLGIASTETKAVEQTVVTAKAEIDKPEVVAATDTVTTKSKKATVKRLPESMAEDELMEQFNL